MSGARSPRPRPAGAVMPTPLGAPPSVPQHNQPIRPTSIFGEGGNRYSELRAALPVRPASIEIGG